MDSFLWCGGRGDYLSQSSSSVCAEFAAVCVCRSYHEGEDEKRKHAVQWTAYVLVIQRIALTNVKSEFYSRGTSERISMDSDGEKSSRKQAEEITGESNGNQSLLGGAPRCTMHIFARIPFFSPFLFFLTS